MEGKINDCEKEAGTEADTWKYDCREIDRKTKEEINGDVRRR